MVPPVRTFEGGKAFLERELHVQRLGEPLISWGSEGGSAYSLERLAYGTLKGSQGV